MLMSLKEKKQLIESTLENNLTDVIIERSLQNVLSQPEGKMSVMYDSAQYSKDDEVALTSRKKSPRYTCIITVRDPLEQDLALDLLDKVRNLIQGLAIGPADKDRFYPDNERFEEFVPDTNIYAAKIDFVCEEIVHTREENL